MARRIIRGGGPRRKTQWAGMGDSVGAAVLPGFVVVPSGGPAILSFNMVVNGGVGLIDEEGTITRMIGRVSARINVNTANVSATLAVGCIVARNEAIVAGVGSLPSPEDDPDSDWLFYAVMGLVNPNTTNNDSSLANVHFDFDVSGQRIVRVGASPVWIAEAQSQAIFTQVGGRYLAKLA